MELSCVHKHYLHLKPEIFQALDTLLDESHTSAETKGLRTAFKKSTPTTVGGSDVHYETSISDPSHYRVRRTQAYVLRSGSSSTVVWPGSYIEVSLSPEIAPDSRSSRSLVFGPHPMSQNL